MNDEPRHPRGRPRTQPIWRVEALVRQEVDDPSHIDRLTRVEAEQLRQVQVLEDIATTLMRLRRLEEACLRQAELLQRIATMVEEENSSS
jgi:hypothetical protein